MTLLFNCMPEAETLVDLARRECAIGFELRFCRSVAVTSLRETQPDADPQPTAADTPKPITIRTGTKQAQIIALLQRPEGAAITEIVAETGWMPHSVRGMISGTLKKEAGPSHCR